MARAQKEKTIDGLTFTVQQLPAMRSLKLMHKLGKTIGPAMLKALSGAPAGKEIKVGNINVADMADGVSLLFDRLSAEDTESIVRELFETTMVTENGQTFQLMPVFDNVLAGKMATLFKAVKFALEVNYQDFLPALLASAQASQVAGSSAASST